MFLTSPCTKFHYRTGTLVVLSNGDRTAQRTHASQEFNNGLVFSAEPLADNQLFQVKIDKKITAWSGSIEIGLTSCDPAVICFPTSATGFTTGTWIVSGNAVMKDGRTLLDCYGWDLDRAMEEDRVGILKTSEGVMHVYFNGVDQGPAAVNLPSKVWAVFDMYGKCAQISIVDDRRDVEELITSSIISLASSVRDVINSTTSLLRRDNDVTTLAATPCARSDPGECDIDFDINEHVTASSSRTTVDTFSSSRDTTTSCHNVSTDTNRLTFHERHGTLIQLSTDRLTAERLKPMDEFNNGVVMTNRPIRDEELFEIRLDKLVRKWSGSIEVGITTHNPDNLDFPATMTNMRSGTIMMSGNGILTNGKGTRRQYGSFNLDELREGNTIGMIRKSSGTLHYFINSVDQGVAASKVPDVVWGVVDLYGMAVTVTIVGQRQVEECLHDDAEFEVQQLGVTNSVLRNLSNSLAEPLTKEPLLFHVRCGSHCRVVSNQKTALRPNAMEDFNNAVVLTQRCLQGDEMFEIGIDRMVEKWAGSIEIGVTTHSPVDFEFPSTMTNVRSGTWMMTGNGIMKNGVTILENYGHNLDKLKAGDRVGALRKTDGSLHFFVNGFDQGLAATEVPPNVYGVVDLYGQAAMATIIDPTEVANLPESISYRDLATSLSFQPYNHHYHHPYHFSFSPEVAAISDDFKTIQRFSDKGHLKNEDVVVLSNRPLRANELFEVVVEQLNVDGGRSIEVGVELLGSETEGTKQGCKTWKLSGKKLIKGEKILVTNYDLDLDELEVGSRIGVMVRLDGRLHFFLDGMDKGYASLAVPKGVYAVISLYGCGTKVSIVDPMMSSESHDSSSDHVTNQDDMNTSVIFNGSTQQFSSHHHQNAELMNNRCRASRSGARGHSRIFSAKPIKTNESFEILVEGVTHFCGGFFIGLTTSLLPDTKLSSLEYASKFSLTVIRSDLHLNNKVIRHNFCPNLDGLSEGDKVGVGLGLSQHGEKVFYLFFNGSLVGSYLCCDMPKKPLYAEVGLVGKIRDVSICPIGNCNIPQITQCLSPPVMMMSMQVTQQDRITDAEHGNEDVVDEVDGNDDAELFWGSCIGKNVEILDHGGLKRNAGFNDAVILLRRPLAVNEVLKIRIEELDEKWSSSLKVGFLVQHCKSKLNISSLLLSSSSSLPLPATSLNFQSDSCIFCSNNLYVDGSKVPCLTNNSWNLDDLSVGDVVTLTYDLKSRVHLGINGDNHSQVDLNVYLGAIYSGTDFHSIAHFSDPTRHRDNYNHLLRSLKHDFAIFPVIDLYGKVKGVKVNVSMVSSKKQSTSTGLAIQNRVSDASQAGEEREKADSENESKEKSLAEEGLSQRVVEIYDCKFFKLCQSFKASLNLPDGFFTDDNLRCYCESCHRLNGEGLYFRKGEPPRDYAAPVGWAAFPIRQRCKNESVDKWHTAYHGADVGKIRRILDSGDVILPSYQLFGGIGLMKANFLEEKSVPEDNQDVKAVILSPTIKYTSLPQFSPKNKYVDKNTGRLYWGQIAIQVSMKPGSYKINSQSTGLEEQLDSRFANTELEWLTKEQKAVVLHSLLIRVE